MDMEGDIIALGKMGHTYVHGRGKARARKDYAQAKYKRGATNLSDDRVEARVVGATPGLTPAHPNRVARPSSAPDVDAQRSGSSAARSVVAPDWASTLQTQTPAHSDSSTGSTPSGSLQVTQGSSSVAQGSWSARRTRMWTQAWPWGSRDGFD